MERKEEERRKNTQNCRKTTDFVRYYENKTTTEENPLCRHKYKTVSWTYMKYTEPDTRRTGQRYQASSFKNMNRWLIQIHLDITAIPKHNFTKNTQYREQDKQPSKR